MLLRPIGESLVLIAPERVEAVREVLEGLTIVLRDGEYPVCSIDVESKTIELSMPVIEQTWCTSFAHFTFYTKVLAGKLITTPTTVDLTVDPDLSAAMRLLSWCFDRRGPWPPNLPRPLAQPPEASDLHVANEVAVCAAAFQLHHELAHYRLGHRFSKESVISIDQERDADYEAADWILGRCPPEAFNKRAFGIAASLITLVGEAIRQRNLGGRSHPRAVERLVNTLDRHIPRSDHVVWGFTMGVLKLHLDNARIAVPELVYDTPRDAIEAYVEVLSRLR